MSGLVVQICTQWRQIKNSLKKNLCKEFSLVDLAMYRVLYLVTTQKSGLRQPTEKSQGRYRVLKHVCIETRMYDLPSTMQKFHTLCGHTVKNAQTATSLLTSCSRLACYQQANIKIDSPGLRQLLDDESVARCMPINLLQVNWFVEICYP